MYEKFVECLTPGCLVFVIDQSASMAGKRAVLAVNWNLMKSNYLR